MSSTLKRIQGDLPNFPQEVIVDWIEPYVKDLGWPPLAERWRGILYGKSFNFWKSVNWRKQRLSLEEIHLDLDASLIARSLFDAYVLDQDNDYKATLGEKGKQRFLSAMKYVLKHGKLPRPLVLLRSDFGYGIADGNHRYLAWMITKKLAQELRETPEAGKNSFLQKLKEKWHINEIAELLDQQDVWVAEDSRIELNA